MIRLIFMLAFMQTAFCCTAFQLQSQDGSILYFRSMEYALQLDSHLLIVPRGTKFVGSTPSASPGITANTKYGYVGMNQSFAKTSLTDGMNEKGLVIGCLYLPNFATYEKPDPDRISQTLAAWELPAFLLSQCATIQEVKNILPTLVVAEQFVVSVEKLGLKNFAPPVHFYITDPSGRVLVVEYVDGIRKIYENEFKVLTNSPPFDWQCNNLSNFVNLSPYNQTAIQVGNQTVRPAGEGSGLIGLPGDYSPPSRFVRAALYANWAMPQKTAALTLNTGFHILNTFDIFEGIIRTRREVKKQPNSIVSNYETTQWVIAHDSTNLKTYFRSYESLSLQMVDLKKIDFSKPGYRQIALKKEMQISDDTLSQKPL
jgi:choloylglycine hydrolase